MSNTNHLSINAHMFFCSVSTSCGNLLKLLVTVSMVTYFIVQAHTGNCTGQN